MKNKMTAQEKQEQQKHKDWSERQGVVRFNNRKELREELAGLPLVEVNALLTDASEQLRVAMLSGEQDAIEDAIDRFTTCTQYLQKQAYVELNAAMKANGWLYPATVI